MSQRKYITSGGLAFSEEKDMEKLHRFSLKGWHVKNFKLMGYTLEKGENTDYIYSIDYRWLKEDEEEEYFDFFSSSGWSHVTSEGDIHLFRANSGTKPIHTDRDTTVEKYEILSRSMKKLAISSVLITLLVWVGVMISSGFFNSFLLVVAFLLSGITVPLAGTVIAANYKKWKIKERKGLVNVVKTIPFLLLLLIIAIIFSLVGNISTTVKVLISGLTGAITFLIATWAIMSVSTRWGRKKS